jgi:hypothetical protein
MTRNAEHNRQKVFSLQDTEPTFENNPPKNIDNN